MAGLIPDNVINDIQTRCDIAEVISGYIPLKRAGRNFKANCPFHQEKTPSFMVNPSKQIYHCFGCGAGGDVFGFVMKYENIEFPEAVKMLARKAGVVIPERSEKAREEASLTEKLLKANELAVHFYQDMLTKPAAAAAREYLAKRDIGADTIKEFKIGFAPDSWDSLLNLAKTRGFTPQFLSQAGLVNQRNDASGYYDKFRNRIIFPIFDARSRTVGFGARILQAGGKQPAADGEDVSLPKYMNSPETALYRKSNILYGLNFSKDAVRQNDRVAIVEGYMDFLIPYQEGFHEIVASCGTSLTLDQIKLLKRFTNNVIMVYDADAAGETATLRNLELFLEEDVRIGISRLPTGYDPDSFVREKGIKAFMGLIEKAQTLFDYKLSLLTEKYNKKTLDGKMSIINNMLPTIAKVRNAVVKFDYIRQLSEVLSVDEESVRMELKKIRDYSEKATGQKIYDHAAGEKGHASNTEKLLLGLMLDRNDFIGKVKGEIGDEYFHNELVKKIVCALYDFCDSKKEISASRLINHFNDQAVASFLAEVISCMDEVMDKDKCFQDCICRLKKDFMKSRLDALSKMIREAEASGDKQIMTELLVKYNSIIKTSQQN